MSIVQKVTAGNAKRTSLELTVRERLILQRLGLVDKQSIAALGKELSIPPSSMTSVVDQLESKKYLIRTAHPKDRRASVLALTNKGRAAFDRELDFYNNLVSETLSPLGEQAKTQVLNALLKFNQTEQAN